MASRYRQPMAEGTLWMVGLTLGLFFLPLVNGLVGGLVGGYRVGDWKRGLAAAILPAAVVAIGLVLILALFGAPVLGVGGRGAIGWLVLVSVAGLFAGSVIGGLIAETRSRRGPAPV